MDSAIFRQLGLNGLDPGLLFAALAATLLILLVLTIIIWVKFSKLNKKYQKFMQGKGARSLEEDIVRLYEDVKYVKLSSEKNRKDIGVLFEKAAGALQKAGLVKYDAFNQMGGKLSFCLVLLDEKNSGFILNSVHGAEGCYSYTKEISKGRSEIPLGDEEKKALDAAMKEIT